MNIDTTSTEFFERKYRADVDPWRFASSPYERNRYSTILHAIAYRRYGKAFEPGCSIGELTSELASICDEVEAIDIAPSAVVQARKRCRELPNVRIACGTLGDRRFSGALDRSVLSEICYYFEEHELKAIAGRLVRQLNPGGVLLAAHWLGESRDHILSGHRVHRILRETNANAGLAWEHSALHSGFRLDRWVKR
jgi:trans-aconitate methyltransferase